VAYILTEVKTCTAMSFNYDSSYAKTSVLAPVISN